MKTLLRAAVIGALTCLAVPLVPQTALAESTSEAAGTGAYFWRGKLPSVLAGQPNPVNGQDTDNDGVARDELGVAVTAPGQTDKESFLAWDLLELGLNDTLTGFVVTAPLSTTGPNPDPTMSTVQSGTTPELQACAPKGGFGSTDAGAYDTKPEVDLARCAKGTYDEAKAAYVFDVTALTGTWLSTENNGIAIVPVALDQPFQVVFATIDQITAEITFTRGEDPFADGPLGEVPVDSGSGTASDSGFDGGFGSGFDSGFDSGSGGSALSSAPLSVFSDPLLADEPLAEPTVTDEGPAPEVAGGQVQTRPVALRSVPAGPPLGFWFAAAALGLLLLAFSLATGAPVVPGAARQPARAGRVLRQVQAMSARSAT